MLRCDSVARVPMLMLALIEMLHELMSVQLRSTDSVW